MTMSDIKPVSVADQQMTLVYLEKQYKLQSERAERLELDLIKAQHEIRILDMKIMDLKFELANLKLLQSKSDALSNVIDKIGGTE
jgi:DNA-directed RNA polymerase subunit F